MFSKSGNKIWGVIVIFIALANSHPEGGYARHGLNFEDETSEEGPELRHDGPEGLYINGDTVSGREPASEDTDETYPGMGRYFEGDIVDDPHVRNGLPEEKYRWPNGIVPFYIRTKHFTKDEVRRIYDGIMEVRSRTCIIFLELTDDEENVDHVTYETVRDGCRSSLGRVGGRQFISLDPGECFKRGHGTVVHETLHALGFHHEHSRTDRDNYVKIHFENIYPGNEPQFYIYPSNFFGVEYDYGSILHYPKYAFANGINKITIEVLQEGAKIGQNEHISSKDAQKVDRMYEKHCKSRNSFMGLLQRWIGM